MLNIVVPISGKTPFFDGNDFPFPKPLIEINGVTMIEYVAKNISELGVDAKIYFMVREEYCKKYHLDDTIKLLLPENSYVIPVAFETKGALCTTLLAIDYINTSDPLLVINSDQFFSSGFNDLVQKLFENDFDGGCLVFQSVHPRWSYVRVEDQQIIEAAEKRPITKHAIAGVYGFSHGIDFVKAAHSALQKDAEHEGNFFLSAAVNECVLLKKRLRAVEVSTSQYFSFYSPQKIIEFNERKSQETTSISTDL